MCRTPDYSVELTSMGFVASCQREFCSPETVESVMPGWCGALFSGFVLLSFFMKEHVKHVSCASKHLSSSRGLLAARQRRNGKWNLEWDVGSKS